MVLRLVACGENNTIVTSDSGESFEVANSPVVSEGDGSLDWYDVIFGEDKFVAVGSTRSAVSITGRIWTASTLLPAALIGVAFGSGVFVAIAATGVYTSTDGLTWTSRTISIPLGASLRAVAFHGDKFIVAGGHPSSVTAGFARQSTDLGVTWTSVTLPANSRTISDLAFGQRWFSASHSFEKLYSEQGGSWTRASSVLSGLDAYAAAFDAKSNLYLIAGSTGKCDFSADGVNWAVLQPQRPFSRAVLDVVAYPYKQAYNLWIAATDAGVYGTAISNQGSGWTLIETPSPIAMNAIAYGEIPENRGGAGLFSLGGL